MKQIPRVMLAAPASGSGKTMITCGILQALINRGIKTAAFKCGPDYIDPMFHQQVVKTVSRNLDTFLVPPEVVKYLFAQTAKQAELSVVEGVMGYYDGVGGISTTASSYEVAQVTETPVILIVNAKGMGLSLIAYIEGFLHFEQDSRICGVILNQMQESLYPQMKALIEERLGLPVYGYVPKVAELVIASRHLGLITPNEMHELTEKLNRLAQLLEKTVALDRIIAIAKGAVPLTWVVPPVKRLGNTVIGIARDEAFCFMYEDNIELLQKIGAEIKFFSPLADQEIPKGIGGLIFYGGYPELYAAALSRNQTMLHSVRQAIGQGMPYLAECGGFMYLHSILEDMDHKAYRMADVIRGKAFYTGKLSRFGYITLTAKKDQILCSTNEKINAHEFHYYDSTVNGDSFQAEKPKSMRKWECIQASGSHAAGFPHLHYYGNISLAYQFVERCIEWGVTCNDRRNN